MGTERNRGGSLETIRNMFKGTQVGNREVNSRHYSKERVVRFKHKHYGRVGIKWPGQRAKGKGWAFQVNSLMLDTHSRRFFSDPNCSEHVVSKCLSGTKCRSTCALLYYVLALDDPSK